MAPLIETIGLKKYFRVGKRYLHAVDDINLKIERGKTLGVVGESGCGKSTLGRVILRLLDATEGKVVFDGTDINALTKTQLKPFRKKMQIVFQDPFASLNPRMSTFELIAEPLIRNHMCANRVELYKRVTGLMDRVGLASRFINSYPHEMDGGRRQRIGISRAIALQPQFIVCDEPVSALDVSIQAQILNLLMDMQEEMGLTYLFITHDLSVVRHIADEIMVMYLGQCVEKAKTKDLFENPKHPYSVALLAAIPEPKIQKNKKEVFLKGEVADPIDPKPGCRFASRCQYCSPQCLTANIPLREIADQHYVACTLYQ